MQEGAFLDPNEVVAAAKIHDEHTVVDFSGGGGFFARAAARLTTKPVWVVDANSELLSRIKSLSLAEGLGQVEVIRGNIESQGGSNLPAGMADVVLVANILFTLEDKETAVKEVARVLKKGARAVVVDWSESHGGLGPHPDHVVSEASARQLFLQNGFQFVEPVPAGAYHWGFIVRK
jgi:ubiquinone/menaquinone biosynthesis C-methylase UbiE